MKRVLRALAVLWALALVGWAIAAAQGWVGTDDTKELTNAQDTGDRPLFGATKSDAGEGAADRKERRKRDRLELQRREQQRREAEALQAPADAPPEAATPMLPATKSAPAPVDAPPAAVPPLLPATKSAPVPPPASPPAAEPVDDPALLPSTKSDMMNGIGGLIRPKGTQIGSGGLGTLGSNPPPQDPEPQQAPAP